jgi:TPR repeat protein
MYCLGLGVPNDTAIAEKLFTQTLELNDLDSLALNGLGFISFSRGEYVQSFSKFNESAHAGSSDGMFNLASLYLSGLGTEQHFQRAFIWFSQALEAGHTPAGFALAVMHLNGIGTARDCRLAVKLLKEVSERSEWVSQTLQMAYRAGNTETAALAYLKLAEAGHEVSQQNLAHLIDQDGVGNSWGLGSITAQRFYELSADQGGSGLQQAHGVALPREPGRLRHPQRRA